MIKQFYSSMRFRQGLMPYIQYMKFSLGPEQIKLFSEEKERTKLVIDHPHYRGNCRFRCSRSYYAKSPHSPLTPDTRLPLHCQIQCYTNRYDCDYPCNKVVSYMVNEPAIISVIENVQNVSCFGESDASVNLGVSGGVPIYSTDWLGQNSQALSSGSYLYTVTDQNNCVYTNTVTITQPSELTVSNSITAVSCNNGADAVATLFISGGTPPYTSVWPNADPMQLNAGSHTFTTHDDNGCVFEDSVFIQQPFPLQITCSFLKNSMGRNGISKILFGVSPFRISVAYGA